MDGLGQPKDYLRKAIEAKKQQKHVLDPNVWEAWESVVVGYVELAKLAGGICHGRRHKYSRGA